MRNALSTYDQTYKNASPDIAINKVKLMLDDVNSQLENGKRLEEVVFKIF